MCSAAVRELFGYLFALLPASPVSDCDPTTSDAAELFDLLFGFHQVQQPLDFGGIHPGPLRQAIPTGDQLARLEGDFPALEYHPRAGAGVVGQQQERGPQVEPARMRQARMLQELPVQFDPALIHGCLDGGWCMLLCFGRPLFAEASPAATVARLRHGAA